MRLDELRGKRIGILGYGREGRATLELLQNELEAPDLTVLDEAAEAEGVPSIVGPLDQLPLDRFDILIKSPGISPYRQALQQAAEAGVRLTSASALWFAQARRGRVIAVSGTKGKSTVSSLVHFLLQRAGRDVALAGNIGRPLLELWGADHAITVVEMSSYQAYDFNGAPDIALITNLYPEHLDWHGGEANYYRDKLRLCAKARLSLVNGAQGRSVEMTEGCAARHFFQHPSGWEVRRDGIFYAGRQRFAAPRWQLGGAHNRANLAAAVAAVDAEGVDPAPGLDALAEFTGLDHRQQVIHTDGEVLFVNDSLSTTPHATLAALEAFERRGNLAVIVGGLDRGVDWREFADALARRPIALVVTRGSNGPGIAETLKHRAPGQRVLEAGAMEEAVGQARKAVGRRGAVILSPGAPSYDEYRDHAERAADFAAAVQGAAG